jgi:nucleoside-diphosphate-sugar epimerase
MQTPRVLVTGGLGYIGSILTEHLLQAGYRTTVLDNVTYGSDQGIRHLCANERFSFVRGDVRDDALLRSQIASHDVIVHLAAIVGMPACQRDPQLATSVNWEAVQLLHRYASPEQLILYPNTNSGYGATTGNLLCTEDTPIAPLSLYGKTKCQAEDLLMQRRKTIAFRLATVFGMSPRMRLDLLVNHFVYQAVKEGYLVLFEKDFKRNFVHVRDVADCFLFAIAQSERLSGQIFNLGLDSANLSKYELALKIQAQVPSFYIHSAPIGQDPDKRNYIVSSEKLQRAGFTAQRGLEAGIRELIKGYAMEGRGMFRNVP